MTILALDHVQMAIPAGGEDSARAFYVGVLGFTEQAKPERLVAGGGAWFVAGSVHVHVGVDPDFHPARKGHPGLLVSGLDDLRGRCVAAGCRVVDDDRLPGYRRFYVDDPFGNRIECLEPDAR